jgi:hypothetical protein
MYKCKRCGYSSSIKGNLKNHFKRKRVCKPVLNDIDISILKEELDTNQELIMEEDSTDILIETNNEKVVEVNNLGSNNIELNNMELNTIESKKENGTPIDPLDEDLNKTIKCDYCGKEFKHRQSKFTHQKKCDGKDKNTMFMYLKEQLEELKERENLLKEEWKLEKNQMKLDMETLLEKVGNNITNNTINIKEQNIILNNFGNENIDYFHQKYFNFLLKAPFSSVPKFLKDLHFNPNHPENHNVKITNKKLPYASVWEGNKWNIRDKKQVIENLVVKGFSIIDGQNEIINNLEPEKQKRYGDFHDKFESDDKELYKNLTKETEMVLINNKDVIT